MKKKRKSNKKVLTGAIPDVMDIKTLANYLGMGRSKIYGLIRLKKIPASRIGRQYRFSKDLVDAWLKERLIMPQETQIALFDKPGK
ncbi:MAG: helix-turn-helix domain-containing protein [Elusimicrobia bacterium]|nr:helix-turn-helix domain-containing protein [Elusimicrobiota bacterium]